MELVLTWRSVLLERRRSIGVPAAPLAAVTSADYNAVSTDWAENGEIFIMITGCSQRPLVYTPCQHISRGSDGENNVLVSSPPYFCEFGESK